MKTPRLDMFDPTHKGPKPENIDLTGITPIKSKSDLSAKTIPTGGKPPEYSTTTSSTIEKPVIASKQSRYQDSPLASKHDSTLADEQENSIEVLRKAVRLIGKDPFFGRFTPEEKGRMKEIVYTYERSGIKTTENEVARIAVNFLMDDYRQNGENSLLDRVLKALHE